MKPETKEEKIKRIISYITSEEYIKYTGVGGGGSGDSGGSGVVNGDFKKIVDYKKLATFLYEVLYENTEIKN